MNAERTDTNAGVTRRRTLALGAAGITTGLAGCLGTRDGPVPDPVVTDGRIDDGWRLVDESSEEVLEESVGPITVTVLERSLVYEHVSVAEALAEALDADGSPVLFFATRIDLRPAIDGLPFGLGRDQLMGEVEAAAEAAFREQLRAGGIDDVESTGSTTMDVDAGHTATTVQFAGQFDLEGDVEITDGVTGSIDDEFEIEALLAVWHDGTDVLLAGGAHPTRPFDAAFEDAIGDAPVGLEDVFGEDAAAVLSEDPETYSEEIEALIRSVE